MKKDFKKQLLAVFFGIITVTTVFGLLWGISYVAGQLKNVNKIETSDIPRELPSFSSIKDVLSPKIEKDEKGSINILLLGISGEDYISGELADTIILASFNEEAGTGNMFSLPRDLWVKDPDENFQKINEFYKIGGGTEKPDISATDAIKSKVEEITGQEIHYTAIISLAGIEEFVDFIGGVETEEGYKTGEEALMYIRDRSRAGGDFDRMNRQQKLLFAIFQKIQGDAVLKANEGENVMELLRLLDEYFATDIPLLKVFELNKAIEKVAPEKIGLYPITPQQENLLVSGYTDVYGQQIYTLHPTAGYEDYSEIQNFINKILNQ